MIIDDSMRVLHHYAQSSTLQTISQFSSFISVAVIHNQVLLQMFKILITQFSKRQWP